ncbi:MAG: hypothetical protein ACE5K8_01275 [Candidatus Zixiibacteriota bacterium]
MTSENYIPVGRTSLAKTRDISYQVQTEYAPRPFPRVTTTVLDNGRVIQKIEQRLDRPVRSLAEQSHAEALIQQQHNEVMAIIQKDPSAKSRSIVDHYKLKVENAPLHEKLSAIPGFQNIFRLNPDGTFLNEKVARQFKKAFSSIFKQLHQIMDLFPLIPGGLMERQRGVYEVLRNRLYFISAGSECYFVTVQQSIKEVNYEAVIQELLLAEK